MPRLNRYWRYWVYTPAPVLVVLGLAIWAIDFVELAVARNPILNLAILSIIGAGVAVDRVQHLTDVVVDAEFLVAVRAAGGGATRHGPEVVVAGHQARCSLWAASAGHAHTELSDM